MRPAAPRTFWRGCSRKKSARRMGVGTLIENRSGAGTIIATEAASRAPPDGNTVLFNANAFVINPHLRKLSYDPLTSFEPICQLVSSPQVIVVSGSAAYRSLAEILDAARTKPGELTLASVGPASTQHIAFEMLKHLARVDMIFVPFNGNGPAVNALLGKHVDSVLVNYSEVAEQVQDGKFRALATTSRSRIDSLPQVPAVAELGFSDFEADVWFGTVVPAKTPAAIVTELADWLTAALDAPAVKPRVKALSLYTVGRCGAAFAADLRQRYNEYGRAIRESNIKGE
ncbi:MAG TPA: tripartite tricarboxylate transporter substrate binding protein [Xanthobacteraceae bacterium]|nr:tripartite tricarboxylate transporter substrate binding protein [Xanthobacteraceae bacterium]